jgi:hypothetical protein
MCTLSVMAHNTVSDGTAAVSARKPYGYNIVQLESDYPEYRIDAGAGGVGLAARLRGPKGHPVGPTLTAADADGLAAEMDKDRAERGAGR